MRHPRDRVVSNQVARLQFLKRNYKGSIEALRKVAEVDPEDLQMHYTAMLAYRGMGDITSAERERKLFQRFKADESAQAITAKPRMFSPEDNNERQAIHDHESIDLRAVKAPRLDAGETASKALTAKQASKPFPVTQAYRRVEHRGGH